MPTNYSGNPSNITTPLTRTVTNCTSGPGGFVQITTSVAHLFATYDVATVSGVVGTTEANTTATVAVVDATNFVLVGVVFTNAYVSGGTVVDNSLTPYFQVPSDGEPGTVEGILVAIQALADRTQYLQGSARAIAVTTALASGDVVVPLGATQALCFLLGGGGGGGGGEGGTLTTAPNRAGGGGAGGGAREFSSVIPVAFGQSCAVTVGDGGAGGTGGASTVVGVAGSDGGDTSIVVGSYNVVAYGAQGGQGGNRAGGVAPAGFSTRFSPKPLVALVTFEGFGGVGGFDSTPSGDGHPAQGSIEVGIDGPAGVDAAPYRGGGGGGGGGSASSPRVPAGGCGNGGQGGHGQVAVTGSVGSPGTAAAANSGCGGGGAGAGGSSGTVGGAGGLGGAGGSGYVVIYWLR